MKILDCKLLSIGEANKIDKSFRKLDNDWWLRSPGISRSYAAYVYSSGRVFDTGKYVGINRDVGVRPALWLESLNGESFKLAGHNWINVFDNVYLCEDFIGYEMFDKESNQYEGSYVQNFILSWFRSQGFEFNTEINLDE